MKPECLRLLSSLLSGGGGRNHNLRKMIKTKEYKSQKIFNLREEVVQKEYESNGFVVLKRGWPDLFCYNPTTGKCELVEVKSRSQYRERVTKEGKVRKALGLTQEQLRMHQYLEKIGLLVKIIHVD